MTAPNPAQVEAAIAGEWQAIIDKDDRTSRDEYPDMALITFDEFNEAIRLVAALAALPQPEALGCGRNRCEICEDDPCQYCTLSGELNFASPPGGQDVAASSMASETMAHIAEHGSDHSGFKTFAEFRKDAGPTLDAATVEACAKWHEEKAEAHEMAALTVHGDARHSEWARLHREDAAGLRALGVVR